VNIPLVLTLSVMIFTFLLAAREYLRMSTLARRLSARRYDMRALHTFGFWYYRNPGVIIGHNPLGRDLLRALIEAREYLISVDPNYKDNGCLERFKKMMWEGPLPPGKERRLPSAHRPADAGRFLFAESPLLGYHLIYAFRQ
jgi:hypothetical protein